MGSERWADLDRVWHEVLARPESERAAAVQQLCAGDPELRQEVESLFAHLARASAAGFGVTAIGAAAGRSLVGRQFGSYRVHTLLGAGGMGEVFQAHDVILEREVALKILPDLWLADPERRARFDREARLLASLNHPNIGAIYGVQDSDGVRALVLELVDGETLADRLAGRQATARRGLPIADLTPIATQILDALEAAHARGIVHRDLKPANIKITPDGRVKVLDFGLALAVSNAGADVAVSSTPTTIKDTTLVGTLLGTPAYMSPEQARGLLVDTRTDVWAFGCVLYEMLTGVQAFGGDSIGDVLANVIKGEPDWSLLPADTPASAHICLRRCLQKDPTKRVHHLADLRLAFEGAFDPASLAGGQKLLGRRIPVRAALAGGAVAVILAVAAMVAVVWQLRDTGAPGASATEPATPRVLVRPQGGGGGGSAATRTIQQALDLAIRGATVSVLPGTYAESLVIKRGLTLEATGERSGAVILAPSGTPETTIEILTPEPVIIRGLTIHAPGGTAIRAIGEVDLTVVQSTLLAANPAVNGALISVKNDARDSGARAKAAITRNVIDGAFAGPRGAAKTSNIAVDLNGDLDAVVEANTIRRTGSVCIRVAPREDLGGQTNVEIANNDIDECHPLTSVAAILVGSPPLGQLSPRVPITATGAVNIIGNRIRNSSRSCLSTAIAFDVFGGRIERNRIIDFVQACAKPNPRNSPGAIWLGLPRPIKVPAVTPVVRFNDIQGNAHAGLRIGPNQTLPTDASCNYWGSPRGPSGIGRGDGTAVVVEPGAPAPVFMPFSAAPIAQTTRTTC